jgi:capsular exopolysaccharide synthesis family protein
LQPQVGLAEVLLNQATIEEAIQKLDGINLDILPVRTIPSNPSELLASPEMKQLLEDVAGRYDRIIIDTPACLGLPDAKSVSEICDGLVMVVRADVTPREDIQAALDILDRRRVVGMVLNGSEATREQYGYY